VKNGTRGLGVHEQNKANKQMISRSNCPPSWSVRSAALLLLSQCNSSLLRYQLPNYTRTHTIQHHRRSLLPKDPHKGATEEVGVVLVRERREEALLLPRQNRPRRLHVAAPERGDVGEVAGCFWGYAWVGVCRWRWKEQCGADWISGSQGGGWVRRQNTQIQMHSQMNHLHTPHPRTQPSQMNHTLTCPT
jgi:hypothetical protein